MLESLPVPSLKPTSLWTRTVPSDLLGYLLAVDLGLLQPQNHMSHYYFILLTFYTIGGSQQPTQSAILWKIP